MTFSAIRSEDLSLPVASDSAHAVDISRQCLSLPGPQPAPTSLGSLNTHRALPASHFLPANLLGRYLLCKCNATIKCNEKGGFIFLPLDRSSSVLRKLIIIEIL